MEPKFVTKPSFRVIGMNYRGDGKNNEIPQLWGDFIKRIEEIKGMASRPMACFGVCSAMDEENHTFSYMAGLGVKDNSEVPEGMAAMDIPEQEYAVFECTLPKIMEAYEGIYQGWLPESEYRRSDGPEFELYDEDFNPENPDSKIYLYVPVVKK